MLTTTSAEINQIFRCGDVGVEFAGPAMRRKGPTWVSGQADSG